MLIKNMADQVEDKRLEGISDIRDESDRNGMRIVIELKRDANPQVVLNRLFAQTQLQTTFAINMLALVNNQRQPKILSLRHIIDEYLAFQEEIIVRRTQLRPEEGTGACPSAGGSAHRTGQHRRGHQHHPHQLRQRQGEPDVPLRAGRRAGTGHSGYAPEGAAGAGSGEAAGRSTRSWRRRSPTILTDAVRRRLWCSAILKEELSAIAEKYGDDRKTEIQDVEDEIDIEDLIEEEECVFTLTENGYIKRTAVSEYTAQSKGGMGKKGITTREEDTVVDVFTASTHDYLLFFTDTGKVYRKKGYQIPESGKTARGTNIVNILQVEQGERVQTMLHYREARGGASCTSS